MVDLAKASLDYKMVTAAVSIAGKKSRPGMHSCYQSFAIGGIDYA